MVGELDVIANVELLLVRVVLIHDDLVGVGLEGAAREEVEAARHLGDGVEVDALHGVEAADGLNHGAGRHRDARTRSEGGGHLVAHGRGGEAHGRGSGRPDEDVRAKAASAAGGGVESSVRNADEREDHGDLHSDGEDREEGAEGPVAEVRED
jgi:hypothetical protein